MSFSDFIRDPLAVVNFGDQLVQFNLLDANGDDLLLRVSRFGTATGTEDVAVDDILIPAHKKFFKRLLQQPTWSQSMWSQVGGTHRIMSRSFPNYGTVLINNRDGWFDQFAPSRGVSWTNRRVDSFFGGGRSQAAQRLASTIGHVVAAVVNDQPKFRLSTVEVPLLGLESRFDRMTSSRVYRGTSYQLELAAGAATEAYISHGAANVGPNLTGDMTVEMWAWLESVQTSSDNYWGWAVITGNKPWLLLLNSARKWVIAGDKGGVQYTATTAGAVPVQTPVHLAMSISGRDVRVVTWDEDAQVETVEEFANVFPAGARDAATNALYRTLRVVNSAKVWSDEYRVWNVARSLEDIRADRHRPLTDVPAACVHREAYDEGEGTAIGDSSASGLVGTISLGAGATATFLWAYEGDSSLAGVKKPDAWGHNFACQPVQVSSNDPGFQVAGAGSIEDLEVMAGGLSDFTVDPDATSLREFALSAVDEGHVLRYLDRGMFRMGSISTLPVAATVKGYNDGPLGYVHTPATVWRDMVTRRGPQLSDPTDLDADSFDDFDDDAGSPDYGVYARQPANLMDMGDVAARSGAGWWGYRRASTLLRIARYKGPSATPDFRLDKRHIVDEPTSIKWQRIGGVTVKFQRSSGAMSEEQLAVDIKGTPIADRLKREWKEITLYDDDAPDLPLFVVETGLYEEEDARVLCSYLLEKLRGDKTGWGVPIKSVGHEISMEDTVTLRWEDQFGRTRLGLDGETNYIVLGLGDTQQDGRINIEVLSE